MKMKNASWLNAIVFGCAMLMFSSCDSDEADDQDLGKGDVEIEITDAATDDAAVKGVFVTVADVKIDGKSMTGFAKQTVDLKAFQEGNAKLLGKMQTDAKGYSNVILVLDLEQDVDGNSPGTYVLTQDNTKYKLKTTASGMTDVVINKEWTVQKDAKTQLVADFDLRKAVQHSDDPLVRYRFVSDNELQAAVRLVSKGKAGTIKGAYQEDPILVDTDKIVVYAYKKGTFTAATETQPQGDSQILFANAVSSGEIKEGPSGKVYTIAFLEEGEYELHFASYEESPETGRLAFKSLLQSDIMIAGAPATIVTIQGGASIDISSIIKGLL